MRQKHSFGSSPPIQYFPLLSCHVSWATSTLMSTSTGSLLTTSPTATSSLLFGLATYGFLEGIGGLLILCGVDFRRFGNGGSGGGGPQLGNSRRAPETERETTDTSEGVGEATRIAWLARGGCGCDGSIELLPAAGLLELGLETVDDRLIVRCREANVELKSLEVEAIGPETDLFVDTTESRLAERFGVGSAL